MRMTETEWLTCAEPQRMLQFLRGKTSDRKLRLFSLYCCHSVWPLLLDKPYRHAVDVAERFVEGLASVSELTAARALAEQTAMWGGNGESVGPLWEAGWYVSREAGALANVSDPDAAAVLALAVTMEDSQAAAEELCIPWATALGNNSATMASILRDIFHAPYQGLIMRASWRTWNFGIVRTLAQTTYQERNFKYLPILADALEEAGCTDADILNHCRQPWEHVRGCWVVDLLLGKS
jgi:hypothetical protein